MMGKSLTLIGTALFLALTTNIAGAQSSKSPIAQSSSDSSTSSPTEIKLSPEGKKILCEYFPLNSRCGGGTAVTPTTPGSTTVPTETTPSQTTTPDNTTTPENVTPSGSGTPDSTTTTPAPGVTPSESGTPSNITPAPGSVTPSESGTPSNITPAPGSVTPSESGTPSNITPAPGSVTPSESGTPSNITQSPRRGPLSGETRGGGRDRRTDLRRPAMSTTFGWSSGPAGKRRRKRHLSLARCGTKAFLGMRRAKQDAMSGCPKKGR